MATVGGIFIPDYYGSKTAGMVGTIATTANTGPIYVGKYRLWKIVFDVQPGGTTGRSVSLRFTTGNTVLGAAAPTPDAASPFFHSYQENIFEMDGSIDSINLANLAADNGAITIAYSILPLARN